MTTGQTTNQTFFFYPKVAWIAEETDRKKFKEHLRQLSLLLPPLQ